MRYLMLMLSIAVSGPLSAADNDRGIFDAVLTFGSDTAVDTGRAVTAPLRWEGEDWLVFGGCAAVVGVSMATYDSHVRDNAQQDRSANSDRYSKYANTMGTIWSLGVLAGSATYGWVADDERALHAARDGLEASIIASVVICPVVKFAVGRERPRQDQDGSDDFRPFSGNSSFPSGHTTQAFTIATVVARTWSDQWYVGALAYGVAASVGLARINDNSHYLSDVLAGAALGTAVGWAVVGWNHERSNVRIEPMAGLGFGGVHVEWMF